MKLYLMFLLLDGIALIVYPILFVINKVRRSSTSSRRS